MGYWDWESLATYMPLMVLLLIGSTKGLQIVRAMKSWKTPNHNLPGADVITDKSLRMLWDFVSEYTNAYHELHWTGWKILVPNLLRWPKWDFPYCWSNTWNVILFHVLFKDVKNDFSDMEEETTSSEVSEVQSVTELYSGHCIEPQGVLKMWLSVSKLCLTLQHHKLQHAWPPSVPYILKVDLGN